jgi:hypothetical protein
LIYGYDAAEWPLGPAIDAFETLAASRVRLGSRYAARFRGLIHPVHSGVEVFAWQLLDRRPDV